jgi:fructosamine-3-kinase
VHGGDVAQSFAVDLDDGRRVFAKTHPAAPPQFFTTEAAGLRWLRDADAVLVPEVLVVSDDPPNHLVLEWIDEGREQPATEESLGRALARLPRAGAPSFGREDRRTTGSRGLPNEPCATWAEFYARDRLVPLARMARDAGALPANAIAAMERLAGRLAEFGAADEPPARLHGDLWAGNRLVDTDGRSWLIDPAAHGGHREFDLAMMRLFGGFGDECFDAYADAYPLTAGWEERVALQQIAPLVVHAIKFGGGYVQAARKAIAQYV